MASSFVSLAISLSLPVLERWLLSGLQRADSTTMHIRYPLYRKPEGSEFEKKLSYLLTSC